MTRVYLSLGSNIRPGENLKAALAALDAHERIELVDQSPWYETRPWGVTDQADFINLVCAVDTRLSLERLLEETQAVELRLGRQRQIRYGPRTIDIDILLADDLVSDTPDLRVPHPGLLERDFMLLPLLDLDPQARLPVTGELLVDKRGQLIHRQIIRKATPDL